MQPGLIIVILSLLLGLQPITTDLHLSALAALTFVFIQVLGLAKTQYDPVMLLNSLRYMLGTFLCRRLLPRFGVRRAVAIAGGLSITGGTVRGGLAMAGVHKLWAIMLPQCLFMLGHGIHQPCSQSGAVGPFPQAAGAASGLNGFLMMVAAFAMEGWLGTLMDGTVAPLTHGIWFSSVLIPLAAWTLVQRRGKTDEN